MNLILIPKEMNFGKFSVTYYDDVKQRWLTFMTLVKFWKLYAVKCWIEKVRVKCFKFQRSNIFRENFALNLRSRNKLHLHDRTLSDRDSNPCAWIRVTMWKTWRNAWATNIQNSKVYFLASRRHCCKFCNHCRDFEVL